MPPRRSAARGVLANDRDAMIGTKLGPYEITAKLGEGGMGEVYRATDTKLKRDVAIKVLPAAFVEDKERLARFEREAQLLAQLHHTNIASIFGMEESEGTKALVMELVEGPTLAERLESGSLPLDESLSLARQIAEALEEAHEKGIIHRDLKPQNVTASREGKVKVLDFGLAKAMDPTGATLGVGSFSQLANSPTLTAGATIQGSILGTAAYMAPEQARGGAVDKRADIWAFGVVLYEMLAGEPLFSEEGVVDTLSAVLRKPIEVERLPATVPARLRELVGSCLERDPKQRLRDIGDARIVIERLLRVGGEPEAAPGATKGHRSSSKLALAVLIALAIAAGAFLLGRKTVVPTDAVGGTPDAGLDEFTHLTYEAGLESSPSLSPDGEFVVYAAIDGGDRDLFLLRIGGQKAINLTEDSPADENHPAFSPDGRFIAFRSERSGGGLFVIGATGESVRRLTTFGDNPCWSPDGREIVFGTEGRSDPANREKTSELWVVPAAGGEPRRIFAGDAVQPAWSPGGERIAFWAIDQGKGIRDVWTIAADGSAPRRVTDQDSVDWNPEWEPDGRHLDLVSDRSGATHPWRVAIDERSGELLGSPEPIHLPTSWSGQLSWSKDGRRLAYRTSERTARVTRLPFDPVTARITGPTQRLFDTTIAAVGLDLSADGWMLFRTLITPEDLYVMRTDGTGLRKLTDDRAKDRGPVWSPDGQMVAFYSNRSGQYEIWTVRRDGSDLRQRTRFGSRLVYFPVWSPDGRSMVATFDRTLVRFPVRDEPVSAADVEEIPVDLGDAYSVSATSWSPGGRWLAGAFIGKNGQLLGGFLIVDLSTRQTLFVQVDLPVPPGGSVYPTISWLPDNRRGVVRWGAQILLVDAETGAITKLLDGFSPDGGTARLSADGKSIYMLEAREEGDLWLASGAAHSVTTGR
jgi:Tol biopolymer transport system component/aminoglycoside phosphotransferase (APT) family kinase protein